MFQENLTQDFLTFTELRLGYKTFECLYIYQLQKNPLFKYLNLFRLVCYPVNKYEANFTPSLFPPLNLNLHLHLRESVAQNEWMTWINKNWSVREQGLGDDGGGVGNLFDEKLNQRLDASSKFSLWVEI